MEPNADARLAQIEAKIDSIAKVTTRTYRIFFWTMVATVVAFVLPLVLLAFAIPQLLSTYAGYGDILNLK